MISNKENEVENEKQITQILQSLSNCVSRVLKAYSCAIMPCVLRTYVETCLECLRAHVPTCLACLRTHVPKCLRTYVFTCQHALRAYVLTYQRGLRTDVLMCQHILGSFLHTVCVTMWSPPTCFASSVSSFDATFSSFTAIVIKVVHAVGKF